ncbi:hypothetical protein [Streptomyces fuscichromogenes]|uniref:Uncharacterized protein n=1 Tax=Streptomyces fuscichromogenes TaxID=1324013 RepID=A0A917XPK8_9ACTN|nr:hypothetical protein [Streptomyces fuscichromogenes]GGN47228.1 hypothetical protein GCM10011578_100700 [Streptomyces fuscichromogenes]
MSRPEWRERIRQMVDDWPPVTPETYAQLALLLAPAPASAMAPVALSPRARQQRHDARPMAA